MTGKQLIYIINNGQSETVEFKQSFNKAIFKTIHLTGDIEKYGTGFNRLREWFSHYPKLDFKVIDLQGFMQVKHSFNRGKIKNALVNMPVNKRQKRITKLISENKHITREILAEECNISVETIKRDIRKLRKLNIIKRIGSDKWGYWEVIKNE